MKKKVTTRVSSIKGENGIEEIILKHKRKRISGVMKKNLLLNLTNVRTFLRWYEHNHFFLRLLLFLSATYPPQVDLDT